MPSTRIVQGDALSANVDVLVLKYAQAYFGLDAAVAQLLADVHPSASMRPGPGQYVLVPTKGKLRPRFVLFVGVVSLYAFDYDQIRSFAHRSMEALGASLPEAKTVGLTVHGPGYGLDEKESFLALIAGLQDAYSVGSPPIGLSEVTIIEHNPGRAQRLSAVFENLRPTVRLGSRSEQPITRGRVEVGSVPSKKPHIFVAMPFSEGEMEDVYGFGIQGPVNASGFLCERVDMTVFTGDVVDRIKNRIDSASLIIAELTGANPNVYLEVGYAWGRGKPTVLLARKGTDMKFDVHGQRCLMYSSITDLSKRLGHELTALASSSGLA